MLDECAMDRREIIIVDAPQIDGGDLRTETGAGRPDGKA
jgi:hypothetical protein